ncbi:hypothetical protein ACH5RR_019805 [Cinchona calisaya]|uniref:Longin domain-containing protein n=1 Tax=Cinchona calisaya TaxID=153742 RepID=A0ABD2ZQF1_9GENT
MMISDPNLVYYACVAKGTTILAEFNSKDADLGLLALKCLEKTPPLHSVFTHTVRNRTYTFFIEDPFAYFAIFDESLENSEGLAFLRSVKEAFNEVVVGSNSAKKRLQKLSSHCFQGEFSPVFHHLLASVADTEGISSPRLGLKLSHGSNGSTTDSSRGGGNGPVGRPLLGNGAAKSLMKKKKRLLLGDCMGGNAKDYSSDDGVAGLSREFTVVMHKNGLHSGELGQHKAKKVWKKHVWVVLSMDLIICTILFVVWLCICRGFKCIDG